MFRIRLLSDVVFIRHHITSDVRASQAEILTGRRNNSLEAKTPRLALHRCLKFEYSFYARRPFTASCLKSALGCSPWVGFEFAAPEGSYASFVFPIFIDLVSVMLDCAAGTSAFGTQRRCACVFPADLHRL